MSRPHICLACRRNILASIRRRRSTGQSRLGSTFVSLAKTRPITGDTPVEDIVAIGVSDNFKNGQSNPKHAGPVRYQGTNPRGSRVDFLESLFEEGRTMPAAGRILPNPTTQAATLVLYERVERLKQLLAKPNESIDGIWQYFVSHLGAAVWHINSHERIPRPVAFKAVTGTLLHRLKTERMQSRTADNLPTVTEITSVYESLDILHPADWVTFVYDLLRKLYELVAHTRKDRYATAQSPSLSREVLAISEDIFGAWKVLCKRYSLHVDRRFHGLGGSSYDWRLLPNPGPIDLTQAKLNGGLDEVFSLLWPRCPIRYASNMTSAALVTFSLLTDANSTNSKYIQENNMFLLAIARLLVAARCEVKDVLKSKPLEDLILKDVWIEWSSVIRKAENIANPPIKLPTDLKHSIVRPLDFSSTILSQKLNQAMTERNLDKIDHLWTEAKLLAQPKKTADSESGHENVEGPVVTSRTARLSGQNPQQKLSQELCNQFISAYMGLRQPDRALNIWNFMIETSRDPNLSTWHAMLEGCRRARNPTSLEGVWTRLQSSVLQPDVKCWRTRISGLIECGKLEQAIRALDEMGRNWREAIKKQNLKTQSTGDINGAVKPTIETINDALSGLLRRGHDNAAKRILTWGDEFGIRPDIVTFNVLIRGLIRDSRIQAVPSLLAQMQKQGIQADVATFTTILDEIFKPSEPLSPERQIEFANLVFTEMEAASVQPNRRTYNKIISSLLQTHPKDMKAVQAVLARMAAQKLEPSRDIYTMLTTHHFSQEPPNLEGVRSLLKRIRLSGAIMDHIFWDRVIEGYAMIGDTANALAVLGREDREGSRVGWPALELVVRALVGNGEVEVARQVVRNVKMDRGGPPHIAERGAEGEHAFWRTVGELGMMDS